MSHDHTAVVIAARETIEQPGRGIVEPGNRTIGVGQLDLLAKAVGPLDQNITWTERDRDGAEPAVANADDARIAIEKRRVRPEQRGPRIAHRRIGDPPERPFHRGDANRRASSWPQGFIHAPKQGKHVAAGPLRGYFNR